MSFDAHDPHNPYAAPQQWSDQPLAYPRAREAKHSGLGIASFVISVIGGMATLGLLVVAGILEASTPGGMKEDSAEAIAVGLGLFGIIAVHLMGTGLAIAGLVQAHRLRIFPVLGLLFNVLVLLGLAGIMILGMTMQA